MSPAPPPLPDRTAAKAAPGTRAGAGCGVAPLPHRPGQDQPGPQRAVPPPTTRARKFVLGLAWVALLCGIPGLFAIVPTGGTGDALATASALFGVPLPQLQVPPAVAWSMQHATLLGVLTFVGSALAILAGAWMIQRRDRGRRLFLWVLLLSTVVSLLLVAVVPQLVVMMLTLQAVILEAGGAGPAPASATAPPLVGMLCALLGLAVVAAHGGIAWRLLQAEVRAEFDRP